MDAAELRNAYLDLLKSSLLATANGPVEVYRPIDSAGGRFLRNTLQGWLRRRGGAVLADRATVDPGLNTEGRYNAYALPPGAMTMIGPKRLDNIQRCLVDVLERDVAGDLIETGVWRGGAAILMRAVLKAYGDPGRSVYAADSFEGLPPPDSERYPADKGLTLNEHPILAVSLEDVRANFDRYHLLDDRVVFVKGWFRDTLPRLRNHQWSVVRLDGDLYESTTDALVNLYPGLSSGGWLIVDDYGDIAACRSAVNDYRVAHGITETIETIDWTGICWKKR
jgi:O-methyltransferase